MPKSFYGIVLTLIYWATRTEHLLFAERYIVLLVHTYY